MRSKPSIPHACPACGRWFFIWNYQLQTGKPVYCSRPCLWKNVPKRDFAERFWQQVQRGEPAECWPWIGNRNKTGYGRIGYGSTKVLLAHRTAYELTKGPIPPGLFVCHACDNPPCCNPDHLDVGTNRDNMRQAVDRQRTASGNRNGAHTRQDRHSSRLYPGLRRGERNGISKLTERDVLWLRSLPAKPNISEVSRQLGVSRATARRAMRGQTWAHVETHHEKV